MRTRTILGPTLPLLILVACAAEPSDRELGSRASALARSSKGANPLADGLFYIKTLGKRCFDFGGRDEWVPGKPVVLEDCNDSVSQQVRVIELDDSHDIELRAGNLCVGVRGDHVAIDSALELQECKQSSWQRFAFDGDALMMGSQPDGLRVNRSVVIEPAGGLTAAGTPFVVGRRDLSDAEYLRFRATDGTERRPHTGFVTVGSEPVLKDALGKGWGTVVEVDTRGPLILDEGVTMTIPSGTTLRGYRKRLDAGPVILFRADKSQSNDLHAFDLESDTRVTGLRFFGPNREIDPAREPREIEGIRAIGDVNMLVDHIEGSQFATAAIAVYGHHPLPPLECPDTYEPWPRLEAARVVGNFLHANVRWGGGYGVVVNHGTFVDIRENTMDTNRHAIAAQGNVFNGYVAEDNFVLSSFPDYSSIDHGPQNDFDIHGNNRNDGHWKGGKSGDYIHIGHNTFLGREQLSFQSRGTPCRYHGIYENSFRRPAGSNLRDKKGAIRHFTDDPLKVAIWDNEYETPDPTANLAVGDFDGDGVEDVFVGTGRAWYYSSGARTEWRYLNRASENTRQLRFGDFDGDGRTDVLRVSTSGGKRAIDISWAGISPWQHVAYVDVDIEDIAVGDFDGDGYADIFQADGSEWRYAPGKKWFRAPFDRTFTVLAYSNRRTTKLRFGDFTGPQGVPDGKTDVFGVAASGKWQVVSGDGTNPQWENIPGAPSTDDVTGLFVADFDGDGWADIARSRVVISFPPVIRWEYSPRARGPFEPLRHAPSGETLAAFGRFAGTSKTDMAIWQGLNLSIAHGGLDPVTPWSLAHLR